MTKQVLILNGPPGVGKDTIAKSLYQYGWATCQFKAPMFKIATAMTGVSLSRFMAGYEDRLQKDKPQDFMGGMSYRQFMIHISEDVMKPIFGDNVFGKRAAEACHLAHENGLSVVFSDGGFIDEVKALHTTGLDVTVIRLHREGFDFNNDSRTYLYPHFCKSIDVQLFEDEEERGVQDILSYINE